MEENKQSRHWFGTMNNPGDKGFTPERFKDTFMAMKGFKYLVFQLEKGDEKETPHYQFYVCFRGGVRFTTIRKLFEYDKKDDDGNLIKNELGEVVRGCYAHFEPVQHGNDNARNYCMKDDGRIDGPWEYGEFVSDINRIGRVNKLNKMFKMALEGASPQELMDYDASTYIRHQNQLDASLLKYKSAMYMTQTRDNIETTYVWGDPGTGKTYELIKKMKQGESIYRAMGENPFDAYMGEDQLFFDEFGGQIPLKQSLGMLDIYPYMLECRYAKRPACYTKVTIVSNDSPLDLYKNMQETNKDSYRAFLDRFKTFVRYVDKSNGSCRNERWKDIDKVYYRVDLKQLELVKIGHYEVRNGIISDFKPVNVVSFKQKLEQMELNYQVEF